MKGKAILVLLALLGAGVLVWRFLAGLGPTTGMSDGFPWGIWIMYDVVTGTALACGGYAVAILVYVMNKGQYHPLVRPAILTSALGYSLAGFSVIIDLGRYWNVYNVANVFTWNLHSVLLEVAVCIMAYTVVLWIELSPAFLEKFKGQPTTIGRLSSKVLPILEKNLIWIIALGLLLPTMHQSSLGALMLIAVNKLHQLWHTPFLPLLFLLSCIGMGYGIVVVETILSHRYFNKPLPKKMLGQLSKAISVVLFLYIIVRIVDLIARNRVGLIFAMDKFSILFMVEMVLFLAPAVLLLSQKVRDNVGRVFQTAVLMIIAGALYRFSTFWFAFNPGAGWAYVPAIPEMLVTAGVISFEILAYVFLVKTFPAIAGVHEPVKADRATTTTTRPKVATIH
jgi:Ni/Fe-hydrogenase subunit HybB-like protein